MAFSRQSAAAVVLAVFSTVSLAGSGLHLLTGCNHFHAPVEFADCHSHGCHGHGFHHHEDGGPADRGRAAIECAASHEECAICRFLAIPQAFSPPPSIVACGERIEPLGDATPQSPAPAAAHLYGARAPPQVSVNA